ncbi:hypothetical protein CHARACLAT_009833 [Characodon lateralis]|uniref:Uncharacterized protein n=1 Tax=Characodon lateralis TaxID=208331 RepID=A0ABU7EAA1_9TELE|nr:hypothetical protein [Characodon lateralis]
MSSLAWISAYAPAGLDAVYRELRLSHTLQNLSEPTTVSRTQRNTVALSLGQYAELLHNMNTLLHKGWLGHTPQYQIFLKKEVNMTLVHCWLSAPKQTNGHKISSE